MSKDTVASVPTKEVRFVIWVGSNEFITEWVPYRVVDFTNRVTALVEVGHVFTVENRNV
jgi:hypothetical protein